MPASSHGIRRSIRPGRMFLAVLAILAALVPSVAHADDAVFTITGRGWGHGIGLSQYGAKGYAERGWTYDRILKWYYQGTTVAAPRTMPSVVKVDIDKDKDARSSWRIAAGSSSTTLTIVDLADPLDSLEVTRGTSVWITFSGGDTYVKKDIVRDGVHTYSTVLKHFPGTVIARTTTSYATSKVKVLSKCGPYSDPHGIIWRGFIRFTPSTTTGHAINYVTMEHYVRGVVPRESPSGWHMESLKAQAVAARSYAYDAALDGSTLWCTTMSQVYNGADCGDPSHDAHETDRTNDAVAATSGKVVLYGSSVVKTFFYSSSGGRTANSKDVWFSSRSDDDSPAYYRSVVDADDVSGNPNYRWTPKDWTGTSMAASIRDKDNGTDGRDPLDYSEPQATVTGISLEKGTSGFVRYVKVTWSNGATHEIKGTTFQSALRLKSSAFGVVLKTPPPEGTRYQQGDGRLRYAGTWGTYSHGSLSGGSHTRGAASGASLTAMFKGTQVSWIAATAPSFGKADVFLDGVKQATVSLYSPSWLYQRSVWTRSGLSADATHTLVVKVLGAKTSASRGTYVSVDAVDVRGTLVQVPEPPVWRTYQQDAAAVSYKRPWTARTTRMASAGSLAFTRSTVATATFTFTGSRVKWIGMRASTSGRAWVTLDGGAAKLVDLYASRTLYRQTVWDSGALTQGRHAVTVRPAGTKNARATDRCVAVDAFQALEAAR